MVEKRVYKLIPVKKETKLKLDSKREMSESWDHLLNEMYNKLFPKKSEQKIEEDTN
jgi:hypothetical protein